MLFTQEICHLEVETPAAQANITQVKQPRFAS